MGRYPARFLKASGPSFLASERETAGFLAAPSAPARSPSGMTSQGTATVPEDCAPCSRPASALLYNDVPARVGPHVFTPLSAARCVFPRFPTGPLFPLQRHSRRMEVRSWLMRQGTSVPGAASGSEVSGKSGCMKHRGGYCYRVCGQKGRSVTQAPNPGALVTPLGKESSAGEATGAMKGAKNGLQTREENQSAFPSQICLF